MIDLSKWRELKRHPLSEAFGDMSDVEFEAVCADMRQHGFDERKKIAVYQGQILDGWNRQRAAIVSHKVPSYHEYKGDDPLGFVIRENMNRRHLDTSQRALIAGKIATFGHGGQRTKSSVDLRITIDKAAEKMDVGRGAAVHGKKVAEHGTKELQAAVMDGDISVSDAAKVATEPAATQRRAVSAVRSGKATTARAAVAPPAVRVPGPRKSKPITDTRLRHLANECQDLIDKLADDEFPRIGASLEAARDLALDLLNKPTIEEVSEYCTSRGGKVKPEQWFSFYEANGWMVGKQRMKDWRACIRYWEANTKTNGKPPDGPRETNAERWARERLAELQRAKK